MRERSIKSVVGLLGAACALALAGTANAALVYSENFDSYANSVALSTAWNGGGGIMTSYTPAGASNAPLVTLPSQAAAFGNAMGYQNLPSTVNNDFTLEFNMISTAYGRAGKIVLTDSTGKQGYSLLWDSSGPTGGGGGFFKFFTVNRTTPISGWNDYTGFAATVFYPGSNAHPSTGVPVSIDGTTYGATPSSPVMADITVNWVKSTGTFTISEDGAVKQTLSDPNFNTFDRIYLTGNTSTVFDNITLSTVPEPTTLLGSLGLMSLWGLRRRR